MAKSKKTSGKKDFGKPEIVSLDNGISFINCSVSDIVDFVSSIVGKMNTELPCTEYTKAISNLSVASKWLKLKE